jgi:transposase-like protein
MFRGISIYEFRKMFKSNEDCVSYLYSMKWNKDFSCRTCENSSFYSGRTKWYRKCTKCGFDESATSNTLFHGMKVPLLKAFEIIFQLSLRKKGMSALEISRTFDVNKDTAALLKRKIQYGMFSSGKNKLKGNVCVDEFAVGGKEKGKQGRSSTSNKTKVVLGCEVVRHKGKLTLGNAYAQVIQNYSASELKPFFDQKIDEKAKIKTDKWSGYKPISVFYDIEQIISEGGKNFKELNNLTMLFKGWLRGIHHHVSKRQMQHYINEFTFRFNRKAHPKGSFNKLIENLMCSKPLFIQLREANG